MRRRRVIAVVVILLALLGAGWVATMIPKVREAAARAKCAGHLKQLGLAIYCFADTSSGRLPIGPKYPPDLPPSRRLSWVVDVLPFVEQQRTHSQFILTAPADDERNLAAAGGAPHFAIVVCPVSELYDREAQRLRSPVTHYVGVAGVGADAAELPKHHPRAGAFGYDRKSTLDHQTFVDGTSNTLLIVETAHDPGHWAFGGPATVRAFVPEVVSYVGTDRPFGGFHPIEFSLGRPRGGVMVVAMADSTVRTFRDTTDPAVLEALATVNGRESLPADW